MAFFRTSAWAIPYARYSVEYQRRIEAGEVEEQEFRPAMAVRGRRVPLHEEEGAAAEGLTGDWEKDEAKRPRGAEAPGRPFYMESRSSALGP